MNLAGNEDINDDGIEVPRAVSGTRSLRMPSRQVFMSKLPSKMRSLSAEFNRLRKADASKDQALLIQLLKAWLWT